MKRIMSDLNFILNREIIYIFSILRFIYYTIKLSIFFFLKKVFKYLVWLIIIICLIIFFIIYFFASKEYYTKLLDISEMEKITQFEKIENLKLDLDDERIKRRIEYQLIYEKVEEMEKSFKRYYPYFDYSYKKKIVEAFENSTLTKDLPSDIMEIYMIDKYIEPHGVKNYELTYKNLIWPMDYETTFVATKMSEFGKYRPIRYMRNRHAGLDLNNAYCNNVYAVYDAMVYKVGYEESGGWYICLKFLYEKRDGKFVWLYSKYRHLAEIYIKQGDNVKQGDIIANMGNTGWLSLGQHLHFELWEYSGRGTYWICVNPVQNTTHGNTVIERMYP